MVTNYANIPATVEFSIDTISTATLSCAQNCVTNAFSNSPVCDGASLQLNSTSHLGGGIYTWSGPNGFTSNVQNPSIMTVNSSSEGFYYVSYTQDTTCNYTDSVWVEVETCASIIESEIDESVVSVYPNPTKEILNISFSEKSLGITKIKLMTLTGQILYQEKVLNSKASFISMNTAEIPSGIYFLIIESENQMITKKVIIE
ncbi:MAG: T9SS type A sorting domain-containing protein [Bacteroidia bacterium]|nr:T9SS type A sorting domain-containing protein [Bacteroidia bacterium]